MRTSNQDTFYEVKKDDTKWMDAKGKIHDIYFMDLWHIYNTVNMLNRKSDYNESIGFERFEIPDLMIERLETEFADLYPEYLI
jgi:hypothetical protein